MPPTQLIHKIALHPNSLGFIYLFFFRMEGGASANSYTQVLEGVCVQFYSTMIPIVALK